MPDRRSSECLFARKARRLRTRSRSRAQPRAGLADRTPLTGFCSLDEIRAHLADTQHLTRRRHRRPVHQRETRQCGERPAPKGEPARGSVEAACAQRRRGHTEGSSCIRSRHPSAAAVHGEHCETSGHPSLLLRPHTRMRSRPRRRGCFRRKATEASSTTVLHLAGRDEMTTPAAPNAPRRS